MRRDHAAGTTAIFDDDGLTGLLGDCVVPGVPFEVFGSPAPTVRAFEGGPGALVPGGQDTDGGALDGESGNEIEGLRAQDSIGHRGIARQRRKIRRCLHRHRLHDRQSEGLFDVAQPRHGPLDTPSEAGVYPQVDDLYGRGDRSVADADREVR